MFERAEAAEKSQFVCNNRPRRKGVAEMGRSRLRPYEEVVIRAR
jgi:hypothetical protein